MRRLGLGGDLHLHQPLSGKADHFAKNVRIGGLRQQRPKLHHLVGHWRVQGLRRDHQPNPKPQTANRQWPPQAARSPRRYGGRASRAARYRRAKPRAGTRPAQDIVDSPTTFAGAKPVIVAQSPRRLSRDEDVVGIKQANGRVQMRQISATRVGLAFKTIKNSRQFQPFSRNDETTDNSLITFLYCQRKSTGRIGVRAQRKNYRSVVGAT